MGDGHQKKTKPRLEVLSFQPTSHSLEERAGLEMELMIHHAYMMKPQKTNKQKSPKCGVLGASSVGCGIRGRAGRMSVEVLHPFPHSLLFRSLPSGRSTVSFIMPFNKLGNVFSRVLSVVLANNQIQRGGVLENF